MGAVSQFTPNQNSTSSIQITLLVNRFMLKGRHLLPLETYRFSTVTRCYRNVRWNFLEEATYVYSFSTGFVSLNFRQELRGQ